MLILLSHLRYEIIPNCYHFSRIARDPLTEHILIHSAQMMQSNSIGIGKEVLHRMSSQHALRICVLPISSVDGKGVLPMVTSLRMLSEAI
jgi:hypothetical protein